MYAHAILRVLLFLRDRKKISAKNMCVEDAFLCVWMLYARGCRSLQVSISKLILQIQNCMNGSIITIKNLLVCMLYVRICRSLQMSVSEVIL